MSDFLMHQPYTNFAGRISREELAEMALLCDRYRAMSREEARERYYPYDLSDGINSLKELDNFYNICIRTTRPEYYFDYKKWLDERLEMIHTLLREANKMVEEHPEWIPRANKILSSTGSGSSLDVLCQIEFYNYPFEKDEFIRDYLRSTKNFREEALKSPLEVFQYQALALELLADCVETPRTEEAVKKCFINFFERMYQHNPEWLAPPENAADYSKYQLSFSAFTQCWMNNNRIGLATLNEFRSNKSLTSQWQKIENILKSGNFQTALDNIELLQSGNIDRLTRNNAAYFYGQLLYRVFNDQSTRELPQRNAPDKLAVKFFHALNNNFAIETQTYEELFKQKGFLYVVSAVERPEGIHLLLSPPTVEFESRFINGKFDKTTHSKDLYYGIIYRDGRTPKLQPTQIPKADYRGRATCNKEAFSLFAVSDIFLVAATEDAKLHVFNRKTQKWRIIDDFLSDVPRSLAIVDDRIYVLNSSSIGKISHLSLSSVLVDGSNRRYYFNNQRAEKQTELDSAQGWMFGLLQQNNDLYFAYTSGSRVGKTYRFDLKTKQIEQVVDCKFEISTLHLANDKLYVLGYGNTERCYELNPATKEFSMIFDLRKLGRGGVLSNPVLPDKNALWVAGDISAYIDLKSPKNSPMLALPNCTEIFKLDRDNILFLNPARYFKVRRKP